MSDWRCRRRGVVSAIAWALWLGAASAAPVATTGTRATTYVQSGLVTQWDGIENAGAGLHDSATNTWTDLIGDLDLTLKSKGSWNSDGLSLTVNNGMAAQGTTAASAYVTVEVVYKMTSESGRILFCSGTANRWVLFDHPSGGAPTDIIYADATSASKSTPVTIEPTVIKSFSAVYSGNAASAVYTNGVVNASPGSRNNTWGIGDGKVAIGERTSTSTTWGWSGEVYAIRLYNRALTAAEIALNANVDKIRFEGADGASLTWPDGYRWNGGKIQRRVRVNATGGKVSIAGATAASGTPVEGWADANAETVPIVATPNSGYVFCGWTGDTSDFVFDQYRAPSLSLPNCIRTLTAQFRASGANIHKVPTEFATLATALASSSVLPGDTILLEDRTHAYSQEATVGGYTYLAAVTNFVTVRGSSRDKVTLDCGGAGGLYINHSAALVEGVTITNFQTTAEMFALNINNGVFSNACINGAAGCISVSGAKPAVWTYSGALITDSIICKINKQHWDSSGILYARGTTFRRTVFFSDHCYNTTVEATLYNGKRPRFENCTIRNCYNYYTPGIRGSNIDIIDCDFYGNSNSDQVSGVLKFQGGVNTVSGCVVTNNSMNGTHALVYIDSSSKVYVTNSLFARNTIANWGVFKIGSASVRLELVNSTVANNKTTSGSYCGGITGDGTSSGRATVVLKNTVFYGNTANNVVKNFLDSYSYTDFHFTNSCFTGIEPTTGANNTELDPKFVDASTGNFRLGDGSSCIDTGMDIAAVTDDLDGKTRPIDGTGEGVAEWDIGCYEASAPSYNLKATLLTFGTWTDTPSTATQMVVVTGSKMTGLTYKWYASRNANGTVTSSSTGWLSSTTNVFENLQPGIYTFRCVVKNDAGDQVESAVENAFISTVGTAYVSTNGKNVWPYDTSANAARSLNDAASIAGTRIVVAAGNYAVAPVQDASTGNSYQAVVSRATRVEGAANPSSIVFDCGGMGGVRLKDSGALLYGMTFTNFVVSTGSGPALDVVFGSVSNVVLLGNGAHASVNQNAVYLGDKALLEDAVITNFISTSGNNRRAVCSVGGTLRRTKVLGCSSAACTLSFTKSSGGTWGRFEDSLLEDCYAWSGNAVSAMNYSYVTGSTMTRNRSQNKANELVYSWGTIMSNSFFTLNQVKTEILVPVTWTETTRMYNCLVANNVNGACAAVDVPAYASQLEMYNCTVVRNASASARAGGVFGGPYDATHGRTFIMNNSIVYGNTTNGLPSDAYSTANTRVVTYSCFREAADYPDRHNIDGGGKVVVKSSGKLTSTSPCRDAGETKAWHGTGKDLYGNPRLYGDAVDMGCCETPPPVSARFIFK